MQKDLRISTFCTEENRVLFHNTPKRFFLCLFVFSFFHGFKLRSPSRGSAVRLILKVQIVQGGAGWGGLSH